MSGAREGDVQGVARVGGWWAVRMVALIALLALIASTMTPASAVVAPQPVVKDAGEQYDPFVSASLVAYTTWASKRTHAFLRDLSDGSTTRIEASGHQGEANGFDPRSDRILYTQWYAGGDGGLYFFNPKTGRRSKAPGVNTGWWEWDGRISSTYLLYLQERKTSGVWHVDVRLFRRSNGEVRTLASYRSKSIQSIDTGSVGDRYATWTVCYTGWDCRAVVHNAASGKTRTIPASNGRPQYAPVVDETNAVVYFTRLGGQRWCRHVHVWRLPVGHLRATPTKVVALPRGKDTGWTSSLAIDEATGQVDYYFERWICSKRTGDIYVAPAVNEV